VPLGPWHGTVEWRMVTDNRFKYTWNKGDLDELYDLRQDPFEMQNLVEQPGLADTLERFRRVLLDWMADTGDESRSDFP
jgi:arylsulfatase A-like enzyme